jgi:hypothetical protein
MLPAPPSPLVAGLESLVVAAVFLGFGYLLVDTLAAGRMDAVLRWALAPAAVAAYTVVLMVLHMATGGSILRAGWVPEVVTLGVAAALIVLKVRRAHGGLAATGTSRRDLLVAGLCVALALVVWGTPVFRLLPLAYGGDVPWHMGFASQLLNGETTPSARITGEVPNAYPWLFHALAALFAHFTPGGRALHALGALHAFLVAGSVLTLFALGREIAGSWTGGALAAVFAGMAGGFGFLMLRQLDVVIDPRGENAVRYLGDLLHKRSYNVSFANLSPPFPRDVALIMMLAFLLLLILGLTRHSSTLLIGGGIALGMAGLAGAEAFFVGMGVAAVTALVAPREKLRTAVAVLVPALAVYAIWFVPVMVSYFRLGGFRDITQVVAVALPPAAILGAWGVSTPFAAFGLTRSISRVRDHAGHRVLFVLLAVSALAILASVLVPRVLGGGFATLGRRHRYWPFVHLAVALFAAIGARGVLDWAVHRGKVLAVGLSALVVGLAVPSPLVASLALPRKSSPPPGVVSSVRGDPGTLLNVIAPAPGRNCEAAVPSELARSVFSYSGYRLVLKSRRVRWRQISDHVPGDAERQAATEALTGGSVDVDEWRALAQAYGVDVVVGSPTPATMQVFQAAQETDWGLDGNRLYVVAWIAPECP